MVWVRRWLESLYGASWPGVLIGLFITILMALLMALKPPFLETIEMRLYDYRFQMRGPVNAPDRVVIAAIDEKSIKRFGRWPWPRQIMARLVKKLALSGAALIVFDIIFSEKERYDPLFAEAIDEAGNVIMPVVFNFGNETGKTDETLQDFALPNIVNEERFQRYSPIMANGVLMPVPELMDVIMGVGHINMFPDSDGTLRWEPLIIGYKGNLYPSLTLQTAALYLGIPEDRIIVMAAEGIHLGKKRYIPTDRWGRMLIYYYGPSETFRHISISDIMDGRVGKKELQGKIVLIGATAVGIYDLRVTPFSPVMAGVEKNANVIASLIEGRFIKSLPFSRNLFVLIMACLIASLLLPRFKVTGGGVFTGLSLSLLFLFGYLLFVKAGFWVNITYPSVGVLFIFIGVAIYNYAVVERYARRIRAMFSSYVTERIVNELTKNPEMARLGGERREITVLFSDIRGFTSFSERHDPEEVVSILNEFLGEMTEIIFQWEGTLDKFIGDAIMAFWGAPMRQENHAELALRCALNMVHRLGQLQQKWQKEGKTILDCGIGINTGEVLVGNIGAEGKKMDYTVIGDHVNLASRVEGLTRKYNASILITEFTFNKVRELIRTGHIYRVSVRGIEKVVVKGRERPVNIYEIRAIPPTHKKSL